MPDTDLDPRLLELEELRLQYKSAYKHYLDTMEASRQATTNLGTLQTRINVLRTTLFDPTRLQAEAMDELTRQRQQEAVNGNG